MISDYYDQTVVVQRFTAGTTGWGSTGTWADASTVSAAVNLTRGNERYSNDKKTIFADYKLFMESTEDVHESDVLLWNSKYLDVVEVKNTLQMGHHKRVLAKINFNKKAT